MLYHAENKLQHYEHTVVSTGKWKLIIKILISISLITVDEYWNSKKESKLICKI